jgi:hypothetical protein
MLKPRGPARLQLGGILDREICEQAAGRKQQFSTRGIAGKGVKIACLAPFGALR